MAHTGYYSDLSSFANVDQALSQALLYRDQAQAAATAADTSEENANDSEVNAANSATEAMGYASSASGSATAAAGSAVDASVSSTAAGLSATNAATSATNSASSATSAANSATTAGNNATAAVTSATNAGNSATAAAGSASSASTSATNAANSATAAAGSASSSATSALNAEASAGAAQSSATTASTSATAAAGSASSAQGFSTQAGVYASNASTSASNAASSASDAYNAAQGAAVPMFTVLWSPSRTSIPAGYVLADGQVLSRATYPAAWSAIDAGNVPVVSEAVWSSTPTERGKYTAGNGVDNFRLPDYNGQSSGSLGATFLRGDGAQSASTKGVIQRDQFQGHTFGVSGVSGLSTIATLGANYASAGPEGNLTTNDAATIRKLTIQPDTTNGTPRFGIETRPLNVTGCWVIKLFGAVTNTGSANAAQLASDYANLASRTTVIEGKQNTLLPTAWVVFGAPSGVIQVKASSGVSSVVRTAVGRYTINFTTAMNNPYGMVGSGIATTSAYCIIQLDGTTFSNFSSARVISQTQVSGAPAPADISDITCVFYGGK